MSNLDVAVTLRLINGLSGPAKEAAKDLRSVLAGAKQLDGAQATKLAADLAKTSGAASRTRTTLAEIRAEAGKLSTSGAATGSLVGGLQGAAQAAIRTRVTLAEVRSEAGKLSASGAATGSLVGGLQGVATAARQVDVALKSVVQDRAGLAGLDAVAKALASDLDRAAAAAGRLNRSAGQARAAAGNRPRSGQEAGATRAAAAEAGGGASVLALGGNALKAAGWIYALRTATRATIGEAITFEKAWADVLKKVNDAPSLEAMKELERTVRQTGIDLGIPREKVAALTAEAAASGIAFQDLERFTRLAAKASIGWDMTPEAASQSLSEIKAGTGMTIGQVETLADKINALGDNSAAKERDIVEMFGRSGAAAKAAGVDFDTSLAFMTGIRSTGMNTEVAARFWSAFTGKLATAGSGGRGTKEMAEGLKMLGLTTKQVADGMKKDAAGTILDIFDRLSKAPEPAKAALKAFGGEWWDEAVRAAQGRAEIIKALGVVANPAKTSGSLDQNLNVQLATTANHLDRLKSLSTEIGDQMGRWALPPINATIEAALAKFNELERRLKVRDAGAEPEAGDPLGKAATALGSQQVGEGARWLGGKVLDQVVGKDATVDPQRAYAAGQLRTVGDQDKLVSDVLSPEATNLKARIARAEGEVKTVLEAQLADVQTRIVEARRTSRMARAGAGPAAARDMSDVEVGEAAARPVVEQRRRDRAELERLQGALERSKGQVVFDEETGKYSARSVVEERLNALRTTPGLRPDVPPPRPVPPAIRSLYATTRDQPVPEIGIAPRTGGAAAFGFNGAPAVAGRDAMKGYEDAVESGIAAAVSKVVSGTAAIKTGLSTDMSPAAAASMSGYTATLTARIAGAVVAAAAGAAQIKAALSFTAAPTITIAPRLGGSGASAPAASPSSAPASAAPAARSAALGGGSRGITVGTVHVHGVRDLASLEREIGRRTDGAARDAQGDALHDTGAVA